MTVYHVIAESQTINVSFCYNFIIILVGMLQNAAQLIFYLDLLNVVRLIRV